MSSSVRLPIDESARVDRQREKRYEMPIDRAGLFLQTDLSCPVITGGTFTVGRKYTSG